MISRLYDHIGQISISIWDSSYWTITIIDFSDIYFNSFKSTFPLSLQNLKLLKINPYLYKLPSQSKIAGTMYLYLVLRNKHSFQKSNQPLSFFSTIALLQAQNVFSKSHVSQYYPISSELHFKPSTKLLRWIST